MKEIDLENINYLLGYFYPDWQSHYDWLDKQPNYQSVIRFSKEADTKETVEKAIKELKGLLEFGKEFDDDDWYDFSMYNLRSNFYPPGIKKTYKEWFEDILRILEEPIEETQKHFIPEFIR